MSVFFVSCGGEGHGEEISLRTQCMGTECVQKQNLKKLQPSITLSYTFSGQEFTDIVVFESDPVAKDHEYIRAMILGTSSFSSTLVVGCFNAKEALGFVEHDFMCLGSKVSNYADAYLFSIDEEGNIEGSYAYAPASEATLKVVEAPDSVLVGKVN